MAPEPSAFVRERVAHVGVGFAEHLEQGRPDRPGADALPGRGILPDPEDVRPRSGRQHVRTLLALAIAVVS
ncbi:MAG TPA: hypothetical protein VE985_09350 [Gaiellaceae bacterium]|nr:hypothetical protein [Gaiellaceae bacterium]